MNAQKMPPVLLLQCIGLLVAAMLLGASYNRLSPLGLRTGEGDGVNPTVVSPRRGVSPEAGPYENIGVRLEIKPLAHSVGRSQPAVEVSRNDTESLPRGKRTFSGSPSQGEVGWSKSNAVRPPGAAQMGSAPVHHFPVVNLAETLTEVNSGRAVLVDARMPKYFESGAIPNAVALYAGAKAEELAAFAAKYPAQTPLILYCYSANCMVADHLADRLSKEFHFSNLRILAGGYEEFRIAGATRGHGVAR